MKYIHYSLWDMSPLFDWHNEDSPIFLKGFQQNEFYIKKNNECLYSYPNQTVAINDANYTIEFYKKYNISVTLELYRFIPYVGFTFIKQIGTKTVT